MAPGVLWVAALLASLLALEFLFRDDAQDGTLEQYALSGQSLTWLLFAKTAAHWLLTGLPLALMAPLAGAVARRARARGAGHRGVRALGSVALSLIGSIGAALTLGVKRSGALLSLLTLPLSMPVLIFGARATELAISGDSYRGAAVSAGAHRRARRHAGAAGRRGRGAHQPGVSRAHMTWTWFHRLGSPPYIYGARCAADAVVRVAGGAADRRRPVSAGWCSRRRTTSRATASASSTCTRRAPGCPCMVYTTMAIAAAVGLIWRIKVAHAVAASCAPIGASFTRCRAGDRARSGAQPMWGTYWEWDPRLTSELILLFLYLGYMGLRSAIEDTAARRSRQRGAGDRRASSTCRSFIIRCIWWNSLHQAPSVMKLGKPTMPPAMLVAAADRCCSGSRLLFAALLLVAAARRGPEPRAHGQLDPRGA